MENQRGTFSKRNREMKLKDRQRDKAERLAARRSENNGTKGPQIAWDEAGGVGSLDSDTAPTTKNTGTPTPAAQSTTAQNTTTQPQTPPAPAATRRGGDR
jgi:hypothetical protein